MLNVASTSTKLVYKKGLKPILFRRQPDNVHHALLKHGTTVQKSSIARSMTKKAWAYSNEPYLQQEVFGLRFTNPVGLSAGFDKNFELVRTYSYEVNGS